jgi:transglutaminase-like putative cysteine protease
MRYKIKHKTVYSYLEAAPVGHNQLLLTPRDGPHQVCRFHRLKIRPQPASIERRLDYFGNVVHSFSVHAAHHRLSVTALSRVEIRPQSPPRPEFLPAWEQVSAMLAAAGGPEVLSARQFCFASPYVRWSAAFHDYARASFPPGVSLLMGVLDLSARIHREFQYDPTATTIHTPVEEVFESRIWPICRSPACGRWVWRLAT